MNKNSLLSIKLLTARCITIVQSSACVPMTSKTFVLVPLDWLCISHFMTEQSEQYMATSLYLRGKINS